MRNRHLPTTTKCEDITALYPRVHLGECFFSVAVKYFDITLYRHSQKLPEPEKATAQPKPQPLTATLGAGVHQIDGGAYHLDPCPEASLSSTLAKTMLAQSPLHAWTASPRLNPDWEPVACALSEHRPPSVSFVGVGR